MSHLAALIAIAAMALVGLDLALRPGKYVGDSAARVERGGGLPLETLSHRWLPGFETRAAYRGIGIAIMVAAFALLAWLVQGAQ